MLQRRVSMSATCDTAWDMSVSPSKRLLNTLNHLLERAAAQIVGWNNIRQWANAADRFTGLNSPNYV